MRILDARVHGLLDLALVIWVLTDYRQAGQRE